MTQYPRRTIADLIMRYELEPTLNDLYVEGEFDKEIIDMVISKKGGSTRAIYEIDTVDIPVLTLQGYSLTEGNKQRVIALANELASISASCQFSCLVDKDLDEWLCCMVQLPRLVWTKYTSIELYFLNEDFIREILIVAAKCKIGRWTEFYDSLMHTLKVIFSIRLADRDLNLGISWVEYKKSFKFDNDCIVFDKDGYINKILNANSKTSELKNFKVSQEKWLLALSGNPKFYIRGHDLVYALAWVVGKAKGVKEYSSEISISRLFVLLSHHAVEVLDSISE